MADDFVDFPVVTTEEDLADLAIGRLQVEWPDWEPEDSDLAVIQIEALAPLAQNAAEAASNMTSAAFRAYGTKLIGEPYDLGSVAIALLTFTAIDDAGYTADAGFEVNIDGFIFTTVEDAVIPALSSSVSGVEAHAAFETSDANDLVGDLVTPQTDLAFVESVSLDGPTSGGADAQDDDEYQDALARQLLLQGKTLVTTRNYELMALEVAGIGRAVAVADVPNRSIDVTVINDTDGLAVSGPIKTALGVLYEAYRLTNWTVSIGDADYWVITANVTVKAYPGFDAAALGTAIESMLNEYLAPYGYGKLNQFAEADALWINDPVIRHNKVIDLIGNIPGVDYVVDVTLATTTTKAITGTAATDVIALVDHGLKAGYAVAFPDLTGGSGLAPGDTVYVIASGLTDDAFKVAHTPGGSAIDFTTNITAGHVKPVQINASAAYAALGDLVLPGDSPLPTPGAFAVTVT
jgi:hypothetical protein